MLWDQPLIDKMLAEFPATDDRFSSPAGAVAQNRPEQALPLSPRSGSEGGRSATSRAGEISRRRMLRYRSLMDKYGVRLQSLGDSRERIAEV